VIHDILEKKLTTIGLTAGQSLFRHYMPADASIGAMTRVPLQGLPIDPHIPGRYKGRIQVIVRHKEPDLGNTLATRVQRALEMRGAREIYEATKERGAVHLDMFQPETLPIFFPRLDGNGYEWSQTYLCAFGVSEQLSS
jgi:hypothetical protein